MKILSYNIQAAIAANSYLSYVSRGLRQVMHTSAKDKILSQIARYISDFDVVCLQEIDLGGFRNGFQNQVQQLLAQTPFTYSLSQINRKVGKLSVHGNLILSKVPLREVVNAPLPSRIKGRGLLAAEIETNSGKLVVANVHLSLGLRDQLGQIRFIRQQLDMFEKVCLMGDFNCPPDAEQLCLLTDLGYTRLGNNAPTYPSWQPKKTLDHIFVEGDLTANCCVSYFRASDHLPIIVDIQAAKNENAA